jgi:hypothetical protein
VPRTIQPFRIGGWKITSCDENGYDILHADERYHYSDLGDAVASAQQSPREPDPDGGPA